MKPTLLFTTLALVLASPVSYAATELEILRSRCQEQERQINLLEQENLKLRGGHPTVAAVTRTEQPVARAAAETAPAAASYTVKAGDSFEKIARKVGTSPQKLAKSNGLKTTSVIRPGQKLKVPGAAPAAEKPAAAMAAAAPATAPAASGSHTVRQGETYSSIARKHGVSAQSLISANPKVKASALKPGQVIQLGKTAAPAISPSSTVPVVHSKAPVEKPAPAVSKAPAHHADVPVSTPPALAPAPAQPAPATAAAAPAPPASQPQPEAAQPSPTPEKKIRPVTVDGEMTYGEFASKFGTDSERLNALNGLDLTTATVLAKGSELYVPAQP